MKKSDYVGIQYYTAHKELISQCHFFCKLDSWKLCFIQEALTLQHSPSIETSWVCTFWKALDRIQQKHQWSIESHFSRGKVFLTLLYVQLKHSFKQTRTMHLFSLFLLFKKICMKACVLPATVSTAQLFSDESLLHNTAEYLCFIFFYGKI